MKKSNILAFILMIVLVCVTLGLSACSDPGAPEDGALLIAHRGLSSEFIENTETAFYFAGSRGFYGIETDLRFTSDGVIVCSHDANPVGNPDIVIEESTYEELKHVVLKADGKDTEAICSYSAYLEACKKFGVQAIIEIKTEITEEQGIQILSELEDVYDKNKATFISFHISALDIMADLAPDIPKQLLISQKDVLNDYLDGKMGEAKYDVSVRHKWMTRARVKEIHEKGLKVGVWTVDSLYTAKRMNGYGVDFITSNYYYGDDLKK